MLIVHIHTAFCFSSDNSPVLSNSCRSSFTLLGVRVYHFCEPQRRLPINQRWRYVCVYPAVQLALACRVYFEKLYPTIGSAQVHCSRRICSSFLFMPRQMISPLHSSCACLKPNIGRYMMSRAQKTSTLRIAITASLL